MGGLEPLPLPRFGRCQALRVIGRGAAAIVYEAVHEPTGCRVAVKALTGMDEGNATLLARFEREARILTALHHPNVVGAHDVGVEEGRPYIVMELLEGETLASRLRSSPRLSPEEIAAVFLPICMAIAAAHEAGVVHRDLKPSNVVLARTPKGIVPKVLDFGVSKLSASGTPDLTSCGTVLGTMRYLSPEQAFGAPVTPASDVYALGVMLFECATGRLPFGSTGRDALNALFAMQLPPLPSMVAPGVPPAFDAIVLRALEREPSARFPSVLALARQLVVFCSPGVRAAWERVLEMPEGRWPDSLPPAVPASNPPPRRKRSPAWVVALTIVALLGAGGARMWAMHGLPLGAATAVRSGR
jgi:serine/threonine-protein kinase